MRYAVPLNLPDRCKQRVRHGPLWPPAVYHTDICIAHDRPIKGESLIDVPFRKWLNSERVPKLMREVDYHSGDI